MRGFTTFLPHRDNPPKDEHNVADIFANDRRGIDECDVVVASLNGITTDDGTAWELGYAFALGKPIIGLHTDWRRRFDHEVINLMIECSLTVARAIDRRPVPDALADRCRAGTLLRSEADRAADAGAADAAVAVGVLRQVLLVVRLGVVELAERLRSRW